MTESPQHRDTQRFYALLQELEERVGGTRQLASCSARNGWPRHGVYFIFEKGEYQHQLNNHRVVRVGTHALTASSGTNLWRRLAQHRGHIAGRNPGSGNHRGSIFRHHVGTALLATGTWPDAVHASWSLPHVDPMARAQEHELERAVSQYIGAMPLLWLAVPTNPDGSSDRGLVEAGAIALLSVRAGGRDRPSPTWLGLHATSVDVNQSGLWNVRHVNDEHNPSFLDVLARHIGRLQ